MENQIYRSYYAKRIHEIVNCSFDELDEVEEIMRKDILHSTLDWVTKEQFEEVAKEAYKILKCMQKEEY